MSATKTITKDSPKYAKILAHFRKQYPQIIELTKVLIHNGQIVAGEWLEGSNVVGFSHGMYAIYPEHECTRVRIVEGGAK